MYKDLCALLVFISALMALATAFLALDRQNSCQAYEENTGRKTRYALIANCYIQDDKGEWWVWEEWKLRGAAKGS